MLSLKAPSIRRWLLPLLAACALPVTAVQAGTAIDDSQDAKDKKDVPQQILDDITPLNVLEIGSSFVGQASFRQKEFRKPSPNAPFGRQHDYESIDEIENSIEYGHRFHLFDKVYLKLGASYDRFDFGTTDAPLPSNLQALTGVVAVEYIVKGQPAAFITSKPGVYFSNDHIDTGTFDAPTTLGLAFEVPFLKNVYGLIGVHLSILAKYPAFPIGGVVWLINDNLRLEAIPPEPRLIYSVTKNIDVFVGGELVGGAFARNNNDDYRPQFRKYSGGVINYTEERVGGGLTFKPNKFVDIDVSGGWNLSREFDYYRGSGKRFETHGAPYAKVEISAEF